MLNKLKKAKRNKKKTQINYITNRNSLVNVEQLNAGEAFWFGVASGIFTAFWLMSDKEEKK